MLSHCVSDRVDRVEGAGVHVACLRADDQRAVDLGQLGAQRVDIHPTLPVDGGANDAVRSEAQQLQRDRDGDVHLASADHGHVRRTGETLLLDVPADAQQHAAPCGSKADDVRHLAAGGETDARGRRQPEQLEDPPSSRLFGDSRRRSDDVEAGVLVPGRDEPVHRQGRRQCPADDEAEEPRTGARHGAGLGVRVDALDQRGQLGRFLRLVRQVDRKRRAQLVERG